MFRIGAAVVAAIVGAAVAGVPSSAAFAADCSPVSKEGALDHTPWGQERMGADRVWPLTRGAGITVAVIDSGISDASPVLEGKVEEGKDYVVPEEGESKVGSGCDLVGHGTSIAGIIAGRQMDDTPFAGMAPDARLMSVRVLPDLSVSNNRDLPNILADAIREAVDNDADVINMSVQLVHSGALEKAVEYAADHGVVMVAAAGNRGGEDGDNAPQFPAAYDNDAMLAVSAIQQDGSPTETSNTGDYVDLAAPGQNIVGPGPEGTGYTGGEGATGTSFAAAFVSGTAALVQARFPDMGPDEVANRMRLTAQNPPRHWDQQLGHGVVDPYRAVTADMTEVKPDKTMAGPALQLHADDQATPRTVGAIILGFTIAAALAVSCGRVVIPIVWRKRRRRRAAKELMRRITPAA